MYIYMKIYIYTLYINLYLYINYKLVKYLVCIIRKYFQKFCNFNQTALLYSLHNLCLRIMDSTHSELSLLLFYSTC